MRAFVLGGLALLAGCARPAADPAAPSPMAAHCPMHAGGAQAMPGMAMMMPMAHDSAGAAHTMSCPMCAQMHSGGTPGAGCPMMGARPAGDSTSATRGCPMHGSGACPMPAAGGCPMHRPAPPDSSATHSH